MTNLAMCLKPRHAKFRQFSARGTFSELELNGGGKKFNGKLISQKR